MTRSFLAPCLIVVGLCLLALGAAWNRVRPPAAYWSEEQAAEFTAAYADLHSKSHSHENGHAEEHGIEFEAARKRFTEISQQLENARDSRSRSATFVKALGIVAILLGAVIHYAGRASS